MVLVLDKTIEATKETREVEGYAMKNNRGSISVFVFDRAMLNPRFWLEKMRRMLGR